MLIKTIYIALLLLIWQYTSAQYDNANKKDSLKVKDAKHSFKTLNTDKTEHSDVRLPYDTILFKDVRYDTTFFALNNPSFHFSNTYNTKESLSGGFAQNVTDYFNAYYTTSGNNENKQLICFIKKFSITLQSDFLEHYNMGNLADDILNQVDVAIDCYYKHFDTLFPAIRVDTSYTNHFNNDEISKPSTIKELLRPLMSKIEQADLDRIAKRKAYTDSEITKRYADRFDIPVLTTDSYKRGIYKNFNEFRINSPSIDSFSVKTDKLRVNATDSKNIDLTSLADRIFQKRNTTVFLYNKNNQLITPSDVFGYSDGQTIWIQHGAFFYPLEKVGNSFEFIYIYHYNDGNNNTGTIYILSPLNMETGKSN
jgi:hypothetical protein